ncbi:MAG TPA: hypothetical protein DCQ28_01495 [Bacteroidetes bacterium]|nr:hypothetical protein [Bacteroidota bacterium]
MVYPNPFNPETKLKMRLPKGATGDNSSLRIFNLLGQVVKTFDLSNVLSGKFSEMTWNGISNEGKKVSSGVYFAVLSTPTKRQTVKLIFTK